VHRSMRQQLCGIHLAPCLHVLYCCALQAAWAWHGWHSTASAVPWPWWLALAWPSSHPWQLAAASLTSKPTAMEPTPQGYW
jgi:hypothetical protein